MVAEKHKCDECSNRKKYDENPNSFVGRLWRWHINFCPGWRVYISSLGEQKRLEIRQKYNIKK